MNENWQAAVYKLVQMTRQGDLSWEQDPSLTAIGALGQTYKADFQGDLLRLYLSSNGARLEFIDLAGVILWSFPQHPSIDDLLVAVEFQLSSVDEKIQKILAA